MKKKERAATTYAFFDIASDSVSAAYVSLGGELARPYFWYTDTVSFEPVGTDFKRYFEGMLAALHQVASNLDREHIGSPDKVAYILHAPWSVSQSVSVAKTFDAKKPVKLSSELMRKLAEEEIERFRKTQLKNQGIGEGAVIMETSIGSLSINGYPAILKEGLKVQNLSFRMFVSLAPEDVRESVEMTIRRFFNREVIESSSFLSLAERALAEKIVNKKDFIMVEVGSILTEMSLFKSGVIKESFTIPYGIRQFLKQVAENYKHPVSSLRPLFRMLKEGALRDDVKISFEKAVLASMADWQRAMTLGLSNLGNTSALPSSFYLMADPFLGRFFGEAITHDEFSQYLATSEPFSVIILERQSLGLYSDVDTFSEVPSSVIIEAVALSTYE